MKEAEQKHLGFTVAQWRLFIFVLVIGLAGLLFHFLTRKNMHNSAALYVGLPFVFALFLSLSPKSKSSMGATMKGMTIALLLSAPVFMEGFLCILMASPILYGVAALFAWSADRARNKADTNSKIQLSVLTVFLTFASLEGTTEMLSFERHNQVEYSRIINDDVESIRERVFLTSVPEQSRPVFLKVFPMPVKVSGEGLEKGDERKLDFVYKKWFFSNIHKGSTVFRVAEAKDDYIRFDIPHDESYISQYLTWRNSEVHLEKVGPKQTKITWSLSYDRKLDPVWYFGPMQNYAAWLTAKVLVNNAAIIPTGI